VTPEHQIEDFKGTARFEIQRRLGAGGFGVVYRAYDRKLNSLIALKVLRRLDASALYRFKKEFRAFADITHPHLVALYELLSEGDQWFFTMELIDGPNIIQYVREGLGLKSADSGSDLSDTTTRDVVPMCPSKTDSSLREELSNPGEGIAVTPWVSPFPSQTSIPQTVTGRLRSAFAQLAEGVCALHERGMLHRDIKPSNVLVTGDGRVVLLDFGLAVDLASGETTQSSRIAGTPLYMSPEQGAGEGASQASDWYSVGIMLYEALAGRPPFTGGFLRMMAEKQRFEPRDPSAISTRVPDELRHLCQELLRPDPKARPAGPDILKHLGGKTGKGPPLSALAHRSWAPSPLVGREQHLESLLKAFESTRQGHAVTVHVRGKTGVGKSTLVAQFVENIRKRDPDVVVLAGRCYERESVPYKALDALVDALSQYLKRLPASQSERVMPRDAATLARLFPVLREVEAVAAARRRIPEIPDSQELRRRGFTALRELLARLGDERPLVLSIDDLQWGDPDSGALLGELLRPPDPPPLLLIVCYRSEETEASPLLKVLRSALLDTEVCNVEVEDLSPRQATDLALALLSKGHGDVMARAQAIARESAGNPFFLNELVRYTALGIAQADAELQAPTLDEAIQARISQLPQQARQLLEVIAVAGRPVRFEEAKRAAGVSVGEQTLLALLRNEHLLSTHGAPGSSDVEIYHDRIRQTVFTHLTTVSLRSIHLRLAEAMEALGQADPEALASHFHGAGDRERAGAYAVQAAARAAEALAFDRSARLYRLAIELGATYEGAGSLHTKLGDALANAGRGAEAAEAYLRGAAAAEPARALDLRRQAAEQLLKSGRLDEGLIVLRDVLAAIGMKLPKTPRRALVSIATRRLYLRLRGLRFNERAAAQLPVEKLMYIDTCWAAAVGLGVVDPIRGADFQARHLQLALSAGESYRAARALALEVGFSATGGSRNRARTQTLLQRTMALAERIDHPHALGLATLNAGIAARLEGRFHKGVELCDEAGAMLRERCAGVAWEIDTAEIFSLTCLVMLGDWRELAQRLPRLVKEVEARGDLYPASYMRTRIAYLVWLAADDLERARDEERRGVELWSQRGFFTLHYSDLMARVEMELYCGDSQAAWDQLQKRWPALSGSLLPRVQSVFIESRHLRARCALALAATGKKGPFLEIAQRDARTIEREGTAWGDPLALLIRAAIVASRGRHQAAVSMLLAAEKGFEAAGMGLFRAAARRRRGELLAGDEGRVLVESADALMTAQKIRNFGRMTAMLSPGHST